MRAGSDDVSSRRIEPVEKLSQRYRDIGTLFRRVACSAWRTDFGEVCSFLRLARMFLRGRSEERLLVIVASFFSPFLPLPYHLITRLPAPFIVSIVWFGRAFAHIYSV
jgi:hypothetical protein